MRKNNRKGFTIVELVIVIAVIAILAGVLIPTFANVVSKANESKALQEAKNAYTNDLAMLDGQIKVITVGTPLAYEKTTDKEKDNNKEYYTKSGDVYTVVAFEEGKGFDADKTYYEATYKAQGEFKANGNYEITINGEYKCICNATTGDWTIEKVAKPEASD